MLIEHLHFFTSETNFVHPVICNQCNKIEIPHGWLICTLQPYTSKIPDLKFIVCSDQCRQDFIESPDTPLHILCTIIDTARLLQLTITEQYQNYIHIENAKHEVEGITD